MGTDGSYIQSKALNSLVSTEKPTVMVRFLWLQLGQCGTKSTTVANHYGTMVVGLVLGWQFYMGSALHTDVYSVSCNSSYSLHHNSYADLNGSR